MPTNAEVALLLAYLFDGVLLAVGIFALISGDRPERIGALVNLAGVIASSALRLGGLASWQAGGPTMLIDIAVAAAFFWLGCRTTRFWPVWSLGLALAIVSVDIVKLALPHVTLFAFASGQVAYAYLALFTLALGTIRARRVSRDPHHGFRSKCPTPSVPTPDGS